MRRASAGRAGHPEEGCPAGRTLLLPGDTHSPTHTHTLTRPPPPLLSAPPQPPCSICSACRLYHLPVSLSPSLAPSLSDGPAPALANGAVTLPFTAFRRLSPPFTAVLLFRSPAALDKVRDRRSNRPDQGRLEHHRQQDLAAAARELCATAFDSRGRQNGEGRGRRAADTAGERQGQSRASSFCHELCGPSKRTVPPTVSCSLAFAAFPRLLSLLVVSQPAAVQYFLSAIRYFFTGCRPLTKAVAFAGRSRVGLPGGQGHALEGHAGPVLSKPLGKPGPLLHRAAVLLDHRRKRNTLAAANTVSRAWRRRRRAEPSEGREGWGGGECGRYSNARFYFLVSPSFTPGLFS